MGIFFVVFWGFFAAWNFFSTSELLETSSYHNVILSMIHGDIERTSDNIGEWLLNCLQVRRIITEEPEVENQPIYQLMWFLIDEDNNKKIMESCLSSIHYLTYPLFWCPRDNATFVKFHRSAAIMQN